MSIILNELIKLLHYADAKDVIFFRVGTSGGLGEQNCLRNTSIINGRPQASCFSKTY